MHKSFPLLGICLLLLLAACGSTTKPAETVETNTEPLAFSAPLPPFTTTVVEATLASPRKELVGELNGVNITVNYGSPSVKGRAIWDSLVPYGEVWRTGANEATRITIDRAIRIGEKELGAGTYGLFTIPADDEWQVIFNRTADQWGAYEYKETDDVVRISTHPVLEDSIMETLEFSLAPNALVLQWEKLRLPIPLAGE